MRRLTVLLAVAGAAFVWQFLSSIAAAQGNDFEFIDVDAAPTVAHDQLAPAILEQPVSDVDSWSTIAEAVQQPASGTPGVGVDGGGEAQMQWVLRQRLVSKPKDPAGWRMLGRLRMQRCEFQPACESFLIALKLDPLNVAAHFDMGCLLLKEGRSREAREHFQIVLELAPDSEYATDARLALQQLPGSAPLDEPEPDSEQAEIRKAGYEVTQFNGSDVLSDKVFEDGLDAHARPLPLSFRLESGIVYNSNVALTPISRELSPQSSASVQGYLAPELEIYAANTEQLRAGPTMRGYFSLNEGDFRAFHVQDYQPGCFAEWSLFEGETTFVPRVDYSFLHDELDGETFGNRHALTTSLAVWWKNSQKSVLYWSIDDTNYSNDGLLPSISSLDGWTNSVGLSHKWFLKQHYLEAIRAGVDAQRADLDGSDYTYNGISLYGEAEVPLAWSCSWVIQGGWGYRDYYAYEFTPSRNEHLWQAGTELRKKINDWLRIAAVFRYDRFDSENALFAAERFITGVTTTIEF